MSEFPIKRYTLLLLCALAFAAAWAAPVKISGLITDEENEPLEFVSVKVSGTALGATSGLDGRYTLSVPQADTIRLVFSCIGYEDSRRRLLDPSGEVTVNVKMTPASYALGGIEVTDYQKQLGGIQRLDADGYRLAPDVNGGSVEGLLTTMAGVSSTNEMSSQYSVRGGSYDENSVYINGIEVYRPQLVSSGQQEGLSIVNPDLVGAIGFSTGGFSAQYGDRMSSVLDITYREPEAFEGSVSASLMGATAAVGSSSRRFNQLHGIRYKQNSSLLGSLDEKGEYDPKFFDYQTSLNFTINSKWKASLLGNIAVNNYRFIPHNRTTKFGTSTDAKEFTVYFDGQ
ncbi:MAG: TonB-dependent receptor, partial [Muribaculaceae bacterium]|nr:TonB-dependent receptor [Muribaculaceae bacterium]